MRKTFVLGRLAGTTSRILLLEGAVATAPVRSVEGPGSAPAKSAESTTVH